MNEFKKLGIIDEISKAVTKFGYLTPTPIQLEAIPVLLDGKDMLASAQTGTGKTAAFAIPILQRLYEDKTDKRLIKALVLSPTRELANQIFENFNAYSIYLGIRSVVIYGGVKQREQEHQLRGGADVLVATPGRLLDLVNQKIVDLKDVSYFVLDEADQMLDMGFINDVKKIVKMIKTERQTMLFSATMPKTIEKLAAEVLKDPVRVMVTPVTKTLDQITQSVYHVAKKKKTSLLVELIKSEKMASVLVFTRTKQGANRVTKELLEKGIRTEAIHGNKSQNARERALENFKKGKTNVLVATDIAARGIDIEALSYVFNYDLPEVPETYIHRIGRTGRAGLDGISISFCDVLERDLLKAIEKHIKNPIDVKTLEGFVLTEPTNVLDTRPKLEPSKTGKPKRGQTNKRFTDKKKSEPFKRDERQQVGKTFESKSDSSVGGFKKTFGKTEGGKSDFRQGRTSARKSSSSQTTYHKKSGR
ncbi:DEAD/DEAH box helicase [Paracholeplasma brassicae]|nr:DEAD/DEAH box helicase [Paracholeplasma brassicae]